MNRRVLIIVAVALAAALIVGGALWLLSREPVAAPPAPEPVVFDTPLATVEGETIGALYWREQYLIDLVLSQMAGQAPPAPEETLDRLINGALLLRAFPVEQDIAESDVALRIANLEALWGIDDVMLENSLKAYGLTMPALERTIARLLKVETIQKALAASGTDPIQWVTAAREAANVVIDEEQFERMKQSLGL
ncbi:MAG: hypothetical protein JXB35_11650 [Anaerolineae bacterium]|nr:hypothetical protein [Anaerolineae bacterium]